MRISPSYDRYFFESAADELLEAAARHRTADGSRYALPTPRLSFNGEDSDAFEGYARTFLLAAFRMVHADPPRREQLADRYREGLEVGLRPGPAAGPPLRSEPNGHQSQVEAASIAIGLWASRPWIWDRLDTDTKAAAAAYLGSIAHVHCTWNNWYLFRAVLEHLGMREPDGLIDEALTAMEPLHRGGGWYLDGTAVEGTTFDYYSGWADNFYPLLIGLIRGSGSEDAGLRAYRERAHAYSSDLLHMIGGNGAPLFQGRSLIYRYAITAPLWALELTGGSQISPGATRHAAVRVLDYFITHSAFAHGTPSLGWQREHLPLAQPYSGGASPYWISKGFVGLLLPPDHPLWTAAAEPLPVEQVDFTRTIDAPGLLLHGTRRDGMVRAVNSGIAKDGSAGDPLYNRLAFSTRTSPTLSSEGSGAEIPDNWVGYLTTQNQPSTMGATRPLHLPRNPAQIRTANYLATHLREPDQEHTAPPRILPAILRHSDIHGPWETRTIRIVRRDDYRIAASGYQLADDHELQIIEGPNWIGARTASGLATILIDHTCAASLRCEPRPPDPFGSHSALPIALWEDSASPGLVPADPLARGASEIVIDVAIGHFDSLELDKTRTTDAIRSTPSAFDPSTGAEP